jgi:hypothetical protein
MELKHTQGPWLIAGEDKSFVYALGPIGTNKFWANVQAAGPEKIGQEEKEANARLIASAPDLLICLMALDECYCEAGNELSKAERHQHRLVLIDVRAAIAKATGAA